MSPVIGGRTPLIGTGLQSNLQQKSRGTAIRMALMRDPCSLAGVPIKTGSEQKHMDDRSKLGANAETP